MTIDAFYGQETDKTQSQASVCKTICTSQQQDDDKPLLAYTSEVYFIAFFFNDNWWAGVSAKSFFFFFFFARRVVLCLGIAQPDCFRHIAISQQGARSCYTGNEALLRKHKTLLIWWSPPKGAPWLDLAGRTWKRSCERYPNGIIVAQAISSGMNI